MVTRPDSVPALAELASVRPDLNGRATESLGRKGLDAIIALGPENFQYVSGVWLPMARGYLDRPNIAVLTGDDEVVLITGVDWEVPVREAAPEAIIRTYDEAGAMPPAIIVDTLADVLRERGLASSRIGIEGLRTPLVFAERLQELVPDVSLVPSDDVFWEWRQQKSEAELEAMRTLAVHTDIAVSRALEKAGEGMTERELAALLMSEILDEGASAVPSVLVASGYRAAGLNAPTDKPMGPGEIVRIDLNSLWRGWYCDMGRMAVVGEADASICKDYADHVEFKQAILEEMVPGRLCSDIYRFYDAEAGKRGLKLFRYPYIGLGHSIGVNNDEFPKLNRGHDEPLKPGMVMNVEPDTIGADGAVHHVEDMVRITDDGVEVITWSRDWSSSELPVLGESLE